MARPVSIKIAGTRSLEKMLHELTEKRLRKSIMQSAVRASAKPLRTKMKALCPKDTGTLRRSIFTKIKTYPSGFTAAITGPRRGATVSKDGTLRDNDGWYGHLVEYGTAPHLIPKRRKRKPVLINGQPVAQVQHPGTEAQPFIRPAYIATRKQCQAAMKDKIWEELHKAIRARRKK